MSFPEKIFQTAGRFYIRREYAVVLFFVLVWQAVLLCSSNGRFIEIDSYTHALRLTDFIRSGAWREIPYGHDNCPFGQNLHFTRITDMFLYLTTLPFLPFTELKRAVLFGGFLYNPVIACLTGAALIWAGKSFFSPMLRATGVLLYFVQGSVLSLFQAGRPDHHVLLNLLLIVLSGCLLYGVKTQKPAYYKTAGVFGGLAVWTSPEGFLTVLFLYAGMTAAWLFRQWDMRQIRLFGQYFFIGTAVCLLVNPPLQGLFYPDNSRLSFLTVVVSGFAFLSFYSAEFLEREKGVRSFFGRPASLALPALLFFGVVFLVYGEKTLFSWPIPPELREIWSDYVSELKPGYSGNIFNGPAVILFYIFLTEAFCVPFAEKQIRELLITTGLPMFLFFVITLISQRFGRPAGALTPFAFLLSVHVLARNILEIPPRFLFTVKATVLFLLLGLYANSVRMSVVIQKKFERITTNPAEYAAYVSQADGCVLTDINQGPETAWETGKAVVGSPYHTNARGIADTHDIFNTTDPERFRSLLKERNVQTVALLASYYSDRKKTKQKDAGVPVFQKILSNDVSFCFISPVSERTQNVLIYRVDFTKCAPPQETKE